MRRIFGVIYKITNKINGKIYIGQTTQPLSKRWWQHCNDGRRQRVLYRAITKYGKENFIIEILTICFYIEQLNYREMFFMKLFNTLAPKGYNLMTGGNNALHSEESKKKMSDLKLGKSGPNLGKQFTKDHKDNLSKSHTGKKDSEETKKINLKLN